MILFTKSKRRAEKDVEDSFYPEVKIAGDPDNWKRP